MDTLAAQFPLRFATLAHGRLGWREAGDALAWPGQPALVLLHGIGSGAASWLAQLQAYGRSRRVLAWDAPGYGDSEPLNKDAPQARDYGAALAQWLRAAAVDDLVLVGHSLGAMMAAAWAAQPTARLHGLVLACPAAGYGREAAAVRDAKYQDRVQAIQRLGPQGLAQERAARLCAPGAAAAAVDAVRANMARVTPRGYAQAAHVLAHDDLLSHLLPVVARGTPVHVLAGALDQVTPSAGCAALAQRAQVPFTEIAQVAHACYVEDPPAFNAALSAVIEKQPYAHPGALA